MTIKTVYPDGSAVPCGKTVSTDHVVQTFTVEVKSMQGVDPEEIKRLIEARREVLDVNCTQCLVVVR